jgi:hypothetical protein
MRKLLILASAVALTAPTLAVVAAPTDALASGRDCRAAGTAGGAVGGAVIGGGLARGGVGGAIVGGLVGAVAGHAIASANCGHGHRYHRRYAVSCRYETHYRDHRPYQVRLCAGRDGIWRPA